jgi:2,4-dienoyl-CoA reductase-like NADH-dependent reductase (Old Yellow Enzyme family)/thioredoxin reductase
MVVFMRKNELLHEKIFIPGNIGKMELKNRLVVPAMATMYANKDGTISERLIDYHENKAKGGWGLIITEDQRISEEAGGFPNLPGLWDDSQIESQKIMTKAVHKYGTKIAAQIYHAGRQTTKAVSGKQPVAPSPLPDPMNGEVPKELSVEEIKKLVQMYADAAFRAKKAGYDAVEIHGAHGYLISTFLSPFSNKRTDDYGGNLIKRSKFAFEIVKAIKEKTGEDYPIIFRISADELVYGGLTIEDTRIIAQKLEEAGIDAIHVSIGVSASQQYTIAPAHVRHGWIADCAAQIKSVVNIPVITVNRINHPDIAETILKSGQADFVAMGRASLADPELPNKTKEGKIDNINICIGCLQRCIGNLIKGIPIGCLVNPTCGREKELTITEAPSKKKVLIAGGGIAGMEAAITSAKRGHEVHIYEKNDRLGGQWLLAAMPPGKEEHNQLIIWQKQQIEKLPINIKLNTAVDNEIIQEIKPDTLIIATGSEQVPVNIPGSENKNVFYTNDVLEGHVNIGKNVIVIGGGLGGPQTAEHLAVHGHRVTLITKMPKIAPRLEPGNRFFLIKLLKNYNVNILTNTDIHEITSDGAIITTEESINILKGYDSIIISSRLKPVKLQKIITEQVKEVITIGDAEEVGDGADAVIAGYETGIKL